MGPWLLLCVLGSCGSRQRLFKELACSLLRSPKVSLLPLDRPHVMVVLAQTCTHQRRDEAELMHSAGRGAAGLELDLQLLTHSVPDRLARSKSCLGIENGPSLGLGSGRFGARTFTDLKPWLSALRAVRRVCM